MLCLFPLLLIPCLIYCFISMWHFPPFNNFVAILNWEECYDIIGRNFITLPICHRIVFSMALSHMSAFDSGMFELDLLSF